MRILASRFPMPHSTLIVSVGKILSPSRKRACVDHVRAQLSVSERRACAVVGQSRSTQRRQPKVGADEAALTAAIVRLATRYGRYGYRRIRRLLLDEGWQVSVKRVYRIWRREGLKVPMKQPKRGRLWLNDGSCIRLRPERPNHVWSYDFMQDRTEDGRRFRMLTVIDEFTRWCLAIVGRTPPQVRRRAALPDRPHRRAWAAGAHSLGQWAGVRCPQRARVAWPDRRQDALHRAGQPVGERLLRELQLQAPRRVAGGRAVLDAARGQGADRAMAAPLQYDPTAFLPRLSPAS